MRWRSVVLACCLGPLVLLSGCGGKEDEELGSGGSGSADGSAGSAEGSSVDASESASASDTGAEEGSASGDSGEASGEGGGESGEVACGDDVCVGDEVCVRPCCGGPAPACYPVPPGGCIGGDTEVSADQCVGVPCVGETCCYPAPCEPAPPFCTPTNMLTCPDADTCTLDDCFGTLIGDELQCECA